MSACLYTRPTLMYILSLSLFLNNLICYLFIYFCVRKKKKLLVNNDEERPCVCASWKRKKQQNVRSDGPLECGKCRGEETTLAGDRGRQSNANDRSLEYAQSQCKRFYRCLLLLLLLFTFINTQIIKFLAFILIKKSDLREKLVNYVFSFRTEFICFFNLEIKYF